MIDALTVEDLVYIHRVLADLDGTSHGIRDVAGVRAAVEAPFATFGGEDLYPDLEDKAAAIGHAVTANHPFVDGNKRVGHAAMVMTLRMNGRRLSAAIDAQVDLMLRVAAGEVTRDELRQWVKANVAPL